MNKLTLIDNQTIQDKIYTIRGLQVMLDKGWGTHRKYLPYVFTEQGTTIAQGQKK